jgi:hypothetical protein
VRGTDRMTLLYAVHESYSPNCVERLSEKPHERANLLAIRRLIAT